MEERVFVKKVCPQVSGVSASGNNWSKVTFIGETTHQYPKSIAFNIFNGQANTPSVGDDIMVEFDVESRSYTDKNGIERWSTDIKAWKITPFALIERQDLGTNRPATPATPQQQFAPRQAQPSYIATPTDPVQAPQPQPQANPDDLPF